MAETQTSGWCHVCQQQRLMTKPKINHVLHLILTLVTLGIWGFVWLTLAIVHSGKSARCVQCGTKAGHGAPGPVVQATVQEVERGPVAMPEIPEPNQPERP